MLNKILMTGRITTDLDVVTEDNNSYCKFSIAVTSRNATTLKLRRLIHSLVSLLMITQNQ